MNTKTFNRIATQIANLTKNNIKFDISIKGDQDWQKGSESAVFEPIHYEVTTLKQLSDIQSILGRPIKLNEPNNKISLGTIAPTACTVGVTQLYSSFANKPGEKFKYPTLKFFTKVGPNHIGYGFDMYMISDAPTEQEEDAVTYRYIGDKTQCLFCIPHTHDLYNYLDKGFFYMHTNKNYEKEKIVLTNELTLDTYLVLALIWLNPAFAKQLVNNCFINANQAKLLRIKFEKTLEQRMLGQYNGLKAIALKEWEKAANSDIIRKLSEGKVARTTYNDIHLTKTTATYETVTIEADNLIEVIQSHIIFDDRTDIYTIIRGYINYVIDQLEKEDLAVAADAKAKVAEYAMKINGINIVLKRTSENTRRYINGVMINMAELEAVAFRASCFDTQANFDLFVKAVNDMSLKWHDALGNGLGVKIHDGMTTEEYKRAEAPLSAPRIKFKKVKNDFHLVIDDTRSVKIKFNMVQTKIATLNRKINNRYGGGYAKHNTEWGRRELHTLLTECCTFETTKKVKDAAGKQIIDVKVEPVLNADGTPMTIDVAGVPTPKTIEVKTPRVEITTACTLTAEDAKFIEKMAREYQQKAIEKSKVALELALKRTGAKLITFKGEEGYLVEGTLRKYVVQKKTNQVFNYDKGNYICIVEPGHQVNVGFDALASRLYALKNDSVMVAQVGTLRHG